MGNEDSSEMYEFNKVNIFFCGNVSSNINKSMINFIFENAPKSYEFKKKIDLGENKEYLFFSGEIIKGEITDILMEQIKEKIINIKKEDNKSIVICFSDDEEKINLVQNSLQSLEIKSIIPFIIFVKNNSFSQSLEEIKKLSKITTIKYFCNSKQDINESNTQKTCEIFKSKIYQIDGYFNERGTIFCDYLFGLLNNAKGEIKKDDKINVIIPGNRSAFNIFLFGYPMQENQDLLIFQWAL